jgi:hypothetical protein
MRKGEGVPVRSENGKSINCPVVDVENDRIWVRFPTNQVIEMDYDHKRKLYVGRLARLEFTVNPEEV